MTFILVVDFEDFNVQYFHFELSGEDNLREVV